MRNTSESIRERLRSSAPGIPDDARLERWAAESLLRRLAVSPYADRFLVKGATLLRALDRSSARWTRDLDLEGLYDGDASRISEIIAAIATAPCPVADGVAFEAASTSMTTLFTGQVSAIRTIIRAHIGPNIVRLRIDVAFGHPIVPAAEFRAIPSLVRGVQPVMVWTYSVPALVAEKLASLVEFGRACSRVQDAYDIRTIANAYRLEAADLIAAVHCAFSCRYAGVQLRRSDGYWEAGLDGDQILEVIDQAWNRWAERHCKRPWPPYSDILDRVRELALPVLMACRSGSAFDAVWEPAIGWVLPPTPSGGQNDDLAIRDRDWSPVPERDRPAAM